MARSFHELEIKETKTSNAEVTLCFEVDFSLPNETKAKLDRTSIKGVSKGEVI